jgi:hypothetical protein
LRLTALTLAASPATVQAAENFHLNFQGTQQGHMWGKPTARTHSPKPIGAIIFVGGSPRRGDPTRPIVEGGVYNGPMQSSNPIRAIIVVGGSPRVHGATPAPGKGRLK